MLRPLVFWLLLAVPALPMTVTEKLEQRVLELLNTVRHKHKLEPVQSDPALTKAARNYCKSMCKLDFFDHVSPVPGETEMEDRIAKAGGRAGNNAENIYWESGMDPSRVPQSVIKEWMESKDHREPILDPENHFVGIGCFQSKKQIWVTANFSDN